MHIKIAKTQKELFDCIDLRNKVFVVEQNVSPLIEVDEYDRTCVHFIGYIEDVPVATARIIVKDSIGKIGRVAVAKEYRNKGIGKELMNYLIKNAHRYSINRLVLGSQLQAKDFYLKLGFLEEGEIFVEANIEHIQMYKNITND